MLAALLWVPLIGCSTTARTVLLDTGEGRPLVHVPLADTEPVELNKGEFQAAVVELARSARIPAQPQEAARRLFEMDARSASYTYEHHNRRVIPLGPGEHLEEEPHAAEVELTHSYLRWCERTGRTGDCLCLLTESPRVNGDGRFALALALAKGAVLDEMLEAFKDMADPHAMVAAVLWTWTTYMVLLSMPDVTVSKGLAAVMTATLISYVGVDTFWGLIVGFKHLMDEADRATTFIELRDAGERYGKVMGRNAARAFAMLATAALGNTAAGLATKVPTLPGSAPAAAVATKQGGFWLPAVAEVRTVAVTAETLSLSLAPGATAMAAQGTSPGSRVDVHHIATIENSKSTLRGGPWTPKFQKLFDRAGMRMKDAENTVPIEGHKGPHPERYHQLVFEELDGAMQGCRSLAECRAALTRALDWLAREIATPGTELNQLVTRGALR
ncbi:hypothetical protein F0U59_49540 [Archangium gephyra]|nr:hypothetical protein F0U59_49540 [Archangium gephyra]